LLLALRARYGDRVVIPFFGRHEVFLLSAPDDVAHVLVSKQNCYVKSPSYKPLMELLGNGLLTSEGELWARQRRVVQPMFARRHLVEFCPLMVDAAAAMLDRWGERPAGDVVDVAAEMSALTLDVVGRALFGADLTGEAAEMAPALRAVLDAYTKLVNNPLFWLVPSYQKWRTPNRRRAEWAENYLRGVVERLVTRRRLGAGPAHGSRDLLDMLLAERSSGAGMSEQQVRDELMTFMLAGHETTATALAWTFLLLSMHPAVRERLAGEVDAVLAGRLPTVADADKLEWTAAVISESMRLYPPAWIIERAAIADDELDGLTIPRGSIVITPPYLVHRSPEHWPNPEGFDPARFLPGAAAGRHRYAYLPFGGGRRQCVGGGFAMLEATLLLAAITQRYRLDLIPGPRPAPQPTVTLRPRDGIPMTLHRR
jgi:cytochrome P450